MTENSTNLSRMDEMNSINVFMNNYNNCFTKSCQICSLIIKDSICIDSSEVNGKEISLRDKMYSCCPELVLSINSKIIACLNCSKIINIIYKFICKCNSSKGQLHSKFPFLLPSILNFYVLDKFDVTVKDEIKTEEVDLSETEISLNVHEQIQSIKNKQTYLQCNTKATVCATERSLKHSQWNDAICKINSKSNSSVNNEEKLFKCFQCEYSSVYKNFLIRHFYTHTGEKPFKCSQCDFRTARKDHLKYHFNTHSGDKPFKCSQCEFKTARKDHLKCHFRIHSGDKPFKCSQCDFTTARKNNLKCHFRTHSGDKPYKCSQCQFKTVRKDHLNCHFRSHTGEKPFKCFQCNFKTARKYHLQRHFRSHSQN